MVVPAAFLDAWSQTAPWPNELDIEQDLVLSRLLIEFASHPLLDEELAFRGGTALHKLHAPVPYRYSNDLDYVRRTNTPAGPLIDAIREVAADVGLTESGRRIKRDAVAMRLDAEPTRAQGVIRVKVEVNTRETSPWRPCIRTPHRIENGWFSGAADVLTFELDELLGTKLRALHQRRKGRDLFDLWLGLTEFGADPDRIVAAFRHYLDQSSVTITAAELRAGLAAKVEHTGFRHDIDQLVRETPDGYSPSEAARLVDEQLMSRLM